MSRLLIWAGSKSLLSAGTVMTFGDQKTDFDVFINDDIARVTFEFPSDSGGIRAEYGTTPAQEGPHGKTPPTVHLRFFNLHAGTFADGPIRLGTVGGNSLWIAYEVTPTVGSRLVKKITYTLWEGPGSDQSGSILVTGEQRG